MISSKGAIAVAAVGVVVSLSMSTVHAATWTVRPDGTGDFPTIQAAVSAAAGGDVIELAPGTFSGPGNTDVFIAAVALTIRSASGDPGDVTIECAANFFDPRRGFFFASSSGSVLEGITITGGYGSADVSIVSAGAVLIYGGTQAVVRDCVFVNNHTGLAWNHAGGAVYVDSNSFATFENCEFRANSGYFGGAVAVNHFSGAEFFDCRFLDNVGGRGGAIWGNSTSKTRCLFARNSAEQGGAIWGNGYNEEVSISCTYHANSADQGGGIYALANYGSPVRLVDTIIADCPNGEAIWKSSSVNVLLSCSDLYGNAGGDWIGTFAAQVDLEGNFSANPCFCSPETDDFQLCADSYCLPGHHPWGCHELVGAYGQGCGECACAGPVAVESTSWGSVKGLYR